jgi:hypothetical protein
VKFLRFEVQKNIGDNRFKCFYENDLARIYRSCGILPHVGEGVDAASCRMLGKSGKMPLLLRAFLNDLG